MTDIDQERLVAYAAAAGTFRDLGRGLAAIRQIRADLGILRGEGRALAARGAEAALAGCVRRVCATEALSRDEAVAKVEVLEPLKRVYQGGGGRAHALMGAMVEAAVSIEADRWLAVEGDG